MRTITHRKIHFHWKTVLIRDEWYLILAAIFLICICGNAFKLYFFVFRSLFLWYSKCTKPSRVTKITGTSRTESCSFPPAIQTNTRRTRSAKKKETLKKCGICLFAQDISAVRVVVGVDNSIVSNKNANFGFFFAILAENVFSNRGQNGKSHQIYM